MFQIHPQLLKDCVVVGRFKLCHLLMMNDRNFPWFILVPDRENISEIYQLNKTDQVQLTRESCYLSEKLAQRFKADKMNVAALGNVVPQLHIHHIVRYTSDPAWPGPVWGKLPARPYDKQGIRLMITKLKQVLAKELAFH
ncbi:MAG: HIT family protein [Gammaproteobacteria bacterium]|nr:HIT family protein [Gammaproteobacteria bacterium]